MRRVVLSTLSLALVAPALSSCALLSGGDHLDDALDLVPADATLVEFVDREAVAERLDVEDDDLDEYLESVSIDDTVGTPLVDYLAVMADEAAFDERDVTWAVSGALDDAAFDVYRLSDDIDLDAFGDELVDLGFEEDELRGRRHLVGAPGEVTNDSGLIGGHYPADFFDVTIDDDEHLVIVGSGADDVLETIDDDADSMTDADTFDDVLDDSDDVEYALLQAAPRCGAAERLTPEQLARITDDLGAVGTPDTTAYLVAGDDAEPSARLAFADDDAAAADLEAREAYLDDGLLLSTQRPFSDVGTAELERDGAVVRVSLDLESGRVGRDLALNADGFLVCARG